MGGVDGGRSVVDRDIRKDAARGLGLAADQHRAALWEAGAVRRPLQGESWIGDPFGMLVSRVEREVGRGRVATRGPGAAARIAEDLGGRPVDPPSIRGGAGEPAGGTE